MRDRMKEKEKERKIPRATHYTSSCKPHGPVEPHSKAAPWMWPTMALEAAGGGEEEEEEEEEEGEEKAESSAWKVEERERRGRRKERERSGITR